MKTFKHNIYTGRCTYLELTSITSDVDALALACGYLTGILTETVAYVGFAKLNPKDKHYVKSIGRQVAQDKKEQVMLQIKSVKKDSFPVLQTKNKTIITLTGTRKDNSFVWVKLIAERGRRVKIEID